MGLGQATITTRQIRFTDLINYTDKQNRARAAVWSHHYTLYGGARGGGKSKFLRWTGVDLLINWWKDTGLERIRVMLGCETYPDLTDRQITKIATEMPDWLGTLRETRDDGLCFFLHENWGSGILCLRNLDDPSKYQSAEFAGVLIDELTKNTLDTFNILRGSLRWPGIPDTKFVGGTNPGSIGHAWVKAYWIDRAYPPELLPRAKDFAFVQALPSDNPYLDQSYWDELNSLPPKLRKAWVEGDWNVFAGMAFPGWGDANICQPFEIPSHWLKWVGIDWGYSKPFACLWLTKNPDTNRVYVYREAYETGLTDRQQARRILELTQPGEKLGMSFADPSMWGKKTAEDIATTTETEYRAQGLALTRANNDRIDGKRKIDRLLMPLPDGKPGLQVFDTCRNFLRTFPLLAYDETHPEDVDTEQEDHLYDALKYALTNFRETKPQAPAPPPPNPWEKRRMI